MEYHTFVAVTSGTLKTESKVVDVVDKKSGALVLVEGKTVQFHTFPPVHPPPLQTPPPAPPPSLLLLSCHVATTKTEDGDVLAVNQFATFIVGAGNFGGKRTSDFIKVICYFEAVLSLSAHYP